MNIFQLVIVQPIFNLLVGIYSVIPGADFGVALIIFTILIRFALWPLVQRQLHQTKAMRKLQPELRRIKKESKGNKQLEGVKMLELYKKHDVKPFRSFLILLIQLPIFIGIYSVVQIFTLHRDQIATYTYPFLRNVDVIHQLILHPEQFHEKLFGFIDLTQKAIGSNGVNIALVIITIIAVAMQYVVSRQTMPSSSNKRLRDVMAEAGEGKQPDSAELNAVMMQKMTKFLPFIFFFVIIGLPGAIALYYAVSNIFAAAQQAYLLRKDTDELEDLADEPEKKVGKKATLKAREKQAKEGTVTRIVANDKPRQ